MKYTSAKKNQNSPHRIGWLLLMGLIMGSQLPVWGGDVDAKLTTADGSTKFTIQDSAAVEVSSITSDGNAFFNSITQTGTGGNMILNQNTLQSGSTFFVSIGTVAGSLFTDNVARVGGVIDRNATDVPVTNTAGETSIYSFSVPGNLLSTNRAIRVVVYGTYLNNSGAVRSIRLRLKYGATTVCDKTSATNAASATAGDFWAEFRIANEGTTNSQSAVEHLQIDRAGVIISPVIDTGTAAEDSTAAKTLDVTVTHSAANAALSLTKMNAYAVLE